MNHWRFKWCERGETSMPANSKTEIESVQFPRAQDTMQSQTSVLTNFNTGNYNTINSSHQRFQRQGRGLRVHVATSDFMAVSQ